MKDKKEGQEDQKKREDCGEERKYWEVKNRTKGTAGIKKQSRNCLFIESSRITSVFVHFDRWGIKFLNFVVCDVSTTSQAIE